MPMSTKNGELQGFVKEQVAEAQKRFAALQTEAEKTFKTWVARGQELQATTTKRASAVGNDLRKRAEILQKKAESLQNRLVQAAGVATQSQVRALSRELSRLSKKVDALIEKKPPQKPDARA
jgi:polyhydroxyalkanoate synthesis regulator phasin